NQNASIKVLRFDSVMRFSHRFLAASISLIATLASLRSAAGAQAFVIVDSQTGYVLEEQEPRRKLQIGSLTKITIPPEAFVGTLENNVGFQPGDSITMRDLLYAALVQSDNIAAYTLAQHVGSHLLTEAGSKITPVDAFVTQMNAL